MMTELAGFTPSFTYDAFISYSREDKEFAKRLEKALEDHKPPKDLDAPQRNLNIFRDEGDLTGSEYFQSIDQYLQRSAKLIVLCSPAARASQYVNDEIRRFVKARGAQDIITILIKGIANNEAKPGEEAEMAFSEALCETLGTPLAADYRSFDLRRDKIKKGAYEGAWYKILAELYGRSRSEVEQRERKRQLRKRNLALGAASFFIIFLSSLTIWALWERNEARSGPRNSGSPVSVISARMDDGFVRLGEESDEKAKKKSRSGVQGEGSARGSAGRQDPFGARRAVRRAPAPDHGVEEATA